MRKLKKLFTAYTANKSTEGLLHVLVRSVEHRSTTETFMKDIGTYIGALKEANNYDRDK